jgi:hypothetical protein
MDTCVGADRNVALLRLNIKADSISVKGTTVKSTCCKIKYFVLLSWKCWQHDGWHVFLSLLVILFLMTANTLLMP